MARLADISWFLEEYRKHENGIRDKDPQYYWWIPLDRPILAACKDYPANSGYCEVYAKVALVNRMYSAQLGRWKNGGKHEAEDRVAQALCKSDIDKFIKLLLGLDACTFLQGGFFMTGILSDVAEAMQIVLTSTAEAAACNSGFVRRRSKLTGPAFVQTLTFGWLSNPEATLEELAQTANTVGVSISPQGLDQRFTPQAAACVLEVLQAAVARVLTADPGVSARKRKLFSSLGSFLATLLESWIFLDLVRLLVTLLS